MEILMKLLALGIVALSASYIFVIVFVAGYLIGAIPTGYLIVKSKTGKDIRQTGSGSTGATNVKRELGSKWFYIVLLLDGIKGLIPVWFVRHFITLNANLDLAAVICAIALIIGHCKPIYLGFKGGKSVATGIGTLIGLNWIVGLIVAAVWAMITFASKRVSVGSIIAVCLAPVLMYFANEPKTYTIYCVLLAFFIIFTHRENIKRLLSGQENKVR